MVLNKSMKENDGKHADKETGILIMLLALRVSHMQSESPTTVLTLQSPALSEALQVVC